MAQTFYGYHRNAALAERHRRQLERSLGVPVDIAARRNESGHYSQRGHHFTFVTLDDMVPGVIIRTGYAGRDKNSYALTIKVALASPDETDQEVSNRLEDLTARGELDGMLEGHPDLSSWAFNHTEYDVIERLPVKPGTLEVLDLDREDPKQL